MYDLRPGWRPQISFDIRMTFWIYIKDYARIRSITGSRIEITYGKRSYAGDNCPQPRRQGGILGNKLLGTVAYTDGFRDVMAIPIIGAERRGAPITAYLRISNETIRGWMP